MNKLIKISHDHYIGVDDSKIKEGDWIFNYSGVKYNEQVISQANENAVINWKNNMYINNGKKSIRDCIKKITYSTQPLGFLNEKGITTSNLKPDWTIVKPLSLSEVEEAINGYSVEKMALNFCDNIVKPKDETRSLYFAYNQGFKAHQELVKDKLLITDKDLFDFLYFARTHSQYSDGAIVKEFIDKFLKKQTEWNIKFDQNGKIIVI
jgi:hypothetical protein